MGSVQLFQKRFDFGEAFEGGGVERLVVFIQIGEICPGQRKNPRTTIIGLCSSCTILEIGREVTGDLLLCKIISLGKTGVFLHLIGIFAGSQNDSGQAF